MLINLNIIMWLIINLLFYIIFSINILISLLSFVMLIGIISFLLLFLHLEYVTYMFLLIYLGGVIIFFLFVILLLHNEASIELLKKKLNLDVVLVVILFFKLFVTLLLLNERLTSKFIKSRYNYNSSYLSNDLFFTDISQIQGDASYFVPLYSLSNSVLLIMLGLILLFSMIGVIVITTQKDA